MMVISRRGVVRTAVIKLANDTKVRLNRPIDAMSIPVTPVITGVSNHAQSEDITIKNLFCLRMVIICVPLCFSWDSIISLT